MEVVVDPEIVMGVRETALEVLKVVLVETGVLVPVVLVVRKESVALKAVLVEMVAKESVVKLDVKDVLGEMGVKVLKVVLVETGVLVPVVLVVRKESVAPVVRKEIAALKAVLGEMVVKESVVKLDVKDVLGEMGVKDPVVRKETVVILDVLDPVAPAVRREIVVLKAVLVEMVAKESVVELDVKDVLALAVPVVSEGRLRSLW
uniref:Uncharacterized protein n=1 Tax=Pithovirus LCPAC104 TaxID=2506589 RepID=A0A481Z686_9VIRU|nr:MAG: hypothetical protein LCPAC104_01360 [Pithovirus LCPAC104]